MGISADHKQVGLLVAFYDFLEEYNKKVNLTSIKSAEEAISRHFLDSLAPLPLELLRGSRAIDIGAGAGFPSVPLAILRPDMEFTALDSVKKKVLFIEAASNELGIANIKPVWGRAENLAHSSSFRESFDVALARAVAPLSVILEYGLPFLRMGAHMLCYKGPAVFAEAEGAKGALCKLGGRVDSIHPSGVPGLEHYIAKVEKVSATPAAYPRKEGLPAKNPL